MSRILIVSPLADIFSGVGNFGAPPLGPARLAAYLNHFGHPTTVWDCNVSPSLELPRPDPAVSGVQRAGKLAEAFVLALETDVGSLEQFDWIGFSILNDTLPTTLGVIHLVHERYPSARLLGGNHEATVNLQDCLGKSMLNGIIMGDAEESFRQLADGKPPHEVPGVIWRNFQPKPSREQFEHYNDLIDWSVLPYEAYWSRMETLYDLDTMSDEERLTRLYEIRTVRIHSLVACELGCTFCSVRTTRRWASGSNKPSIVNLSNDALARTLLKVKEQVPGLMTIYDSCDEAFLGPGRAAEYAVVLNDIKPAMDAGLPRGIRYVIQCRTNDVTEKVVPELARAGIGCLAMGVESAVERLRHSVVKPVFETHLRNVIRWCDEYRINPYLLIILFLPETTVPELHEMVTNLRLYISLGATISIEPFTIAYLGTDLHDNSEYLTEHVTYDIPFSGRPAKKLKWATLIWPRDPEVCSILQEFRRVIDDQIEQARNRLGVRHAYKGFTGKVSIDCLEEVLDRYERGLLPGWDPTGEGRRGPVYQDYGDQISGSDAAANAEVMLRAHKTAGRFRSLHSLMDDPNAGIRTRVKDPARPNEFESEA